MDENRLIGIATSFKGSHVSYKPEWDATLGRVGEKMFMMIGVDNLNRHIVTLKLDPDQGDALRKLYDGVMPGYYMNKTHWNSFLLDGSVPDDLIEDALQTSYGLILKSLPVKVRESIING